jgi:hypothetical protein
MWNHLTAVMADVHAVAAFLEHQTWSTLDLHDSLSKKAM